MTTTLTTADIHLAILKGFCDNRSTYQRYSTVYRNLLKSGSETIPGAVQALFRCIHRIYDHPINNPALESSERISRSDLILTITSYLPSRWHTGSDSLLPILDKLFSIDVNTNVLDGFFAKLQQSILRHRLVQVLSESYDTNHNEEEIYKLCTEVVNQRTAQDQFGEDSTNNLSTLVEDFSLERLSQSAYPPGLRWPLQSLNKALGSLRKGDFGFVFARPETGKTTFLAHSVTHFASQIDRPILWLNNEGQTEKVYKRCMQAALGKEYHEIYHNLPAAHAEFLSKGGGYIHFLKPEQNNRKDIDYLVRHFSPSLLVLDQIDKIHGFADERNDLVLGSIYQWAREHALISCPVIGICQAGQSGEGKRWLTMNDVDNSKTAKQAEADWILGIGKVLDDSLAFDRFLHLSKNKLVGDEDSDPTLRHGKWVCLINPEHAQYKDIE